MIVYKARGLHHFLHIFKVEGSVFPFALGLAVPCAALSVVVKLLIDEDYLAGWLGDNNVSLSNNSVWSSFNFLLGFLVVFRTSQAYVRFWEGCTATHRMRAEWFDAAAAVVAFCKHSSEREGIANFQNTLIRLFSMLHSVALAEIEDCNNVTRTVDDIHAFKYELIDIDGIDQDSLVAVMHSETKVELVHQWIQQLIIENISTKVLSIPPPILSRVFQEVANGMVAFHEAIKISSIPFPFPYAQTCDFLLILHTVLVPIITAQWVTTPWWAGVFAFVQVLIFWALNAIAVEMENPFGDDKNDMDMKSMQEEMNSFLLLLLSPEAQRTPCLSKNAVVVMPGEDCAAARHNTIRQRRASFFDAWANLPQSIPQGSDSLEQSLAPTSTADTKTTKYTTATKPRSSNNSKHTSASKHTSGSKHTFTVSRSLRTRSLSLTKHASGSPYGLQDSATDYEIKDYADLCGSDNSREYAKISAESAHVRFACDTVAEAHESGSVHEISSLEEDSPDCVAIGMPLTAHKTDPLSGKPLALPDVTIQSNWLAHEVPRFNPRVSPRIQPSLPSDGTDHDLVKTTLIDS